MGFDAKKVLRPLQIRLRRTVPLVSPSLDRRGKALHHKGAGQSPVPDWYRGEGDIHPHPTLPHPFATLKGRQGGGNFGCYFFRGLVLYISLVAILLFITETGGTAEKRLPEEADTAAIKTLMKKLERDTQMFEDALEIGDLQEGMHGGDGRPIRIGDQGVQKEGRGLLCKHPGVNGLYPAIHPAGSNLPLPGGQRILSGLP